MCNLRDLHHFQRLLWAREAVVFLVEESEVHSPEDAQRMVQAGMDGCPDHIVMNFVDSCLLFARSRGLRSAGHDIACSVSYFHSVTLPGFSLFLTAPFPSFKF